MPQGHTTALTLTPDDQATLTSWQRSTTIRAGLAQRGRLVLLVATGHTITAAATRVGLSRSKAHKWLKRYETQGLAGLRDKTGRGRRRGA